MSCFNLIIIGIREELDSETMRSIGRCFGHHQAVLPCGREWPQEDLFGEVTRAAIIALRPLFVYSDNGYPHQNVCHDANESR